VLYYPGVYTSHANDAKVNKTTGPNNITACVITNHVNVLGPPLTAMFNKSLKAGVLHME